MSQPATYTTGTIAGKFGVPVWQIRRLFQRGLLPEPGRAGMYRLFTEADLPALEAALREAGYLPEAAAAAAATHEPEPAA